MAKAKKQSTTGMKWKKKRFYPIISPVYLGEKIIGETPVYDPNLLVKRIVTVNLMSITGQPSKKDINVGFEITHIQDAKAQTNLVRYEIMPASIKRMVRRDRTKVDASFVAVTKDDIPVRVKPFLLTNTKTDKSVKKALILECQKLVLIYFSKKIYSEIVPALLQDSLQKELYSKLRKVHPLKTCTIRSFSIEHPKSGKAHAKKHEGAEGEAQPSEEEIAEEEIEDNAEETATKEEGKEEKEKEEEEDIESPELSEEEPEAEDASSED